MKGPFRRIRPSPSGTAYHEDVDRFRKAKTEGKSWLAKLEAQERDKTGIKNLKIKYNKVFGYYLEVTNSYKDMVPGTWMRKQTLTNAERYITPELKELEDTILGAEEKLTAPGIRPVLRAAGQHCFPGAADSEDGQGRGQVDVFASLAFVAERNHFVRPKMNEKGIIDIKGGRHPVVEQMIDNDMFIPNDTYLDNNANGFPSSPARTWPENPPTCARRPSSC